MGKQLNFTKKEQKKITDCITDMGSVLLNKMDKGFIAPTVEGKMIIDDVGREVVFSVTAQNSTKKLKIL